MIFDHNNIYELDGIKYRLIRMNDDGVGVFQQLNPDGSDYVTYNKNSQGEDTYVKDRGRRIIYNRLNQMKLWTDTF